MDQSDGLLSLLMALWGFTRGFTRKGLQSKCATASLLIKSNKCMKEEKQLIVVLAQRSRHIMVTCGRKQRRTSPAYRESMCGWVQ